MEMKKIIRTFMVMLLMAAMLSGTALAEEITPQYGAMADALKAGGFFKGYEDGSYRLYNGMNRAEGAAMLCRMLGKETEAQSGTYSHPFSDVPAWAGPYVGYLYENGLTNGIGGGKFGSTNPVTAAQYFTFVLRSLGYDDANGDFTWSRSLEKALQLGMIDSTEYTALKNERFLRDHAVLATYRGLNCLVKEEDQLLVEKLYNSGDIGLEAKEAVMASVEGGEARQDNDMKKLLVLGNYELTDIDSVTITENIDFEMSSVDPDSGETVIIMAADMNQTIYRDSANMQASSYVDSDSNFIGIDIASYAEWYAEGSHFYIYDESISSFTGSDPEIAFGDYYGDSEHADDYDKLFGDFSTVIDTSVFETADEADYSGFTLSETDTAYIITANEGVTSFVEMESELEGSDIETVTLEIVIDKETGVIVSCVLDIAATDTDGYDFQMSYSFTASDINATTVAIPENIANNL